MAQKKKSKLEFDCLAVTEVFDCLAVTEVNVTKFPNLPGASHIKGVAEIVLNDQLILRGLRIVDGTAGLFVSYPIDPFFKGEDLRNIAIPITRQLREHIENCILRKYQEIANQET